MSLGSPISEPDWKLFRKLHPIALERFCQRILSEIDQIVADPAKTAHERYVAVYQLIQSRDKELENSFNDFRRSTALLQLVNMRALGLLTDEELSRFSAQSRAVVITLGDGKWDEG